MLDVVNEVGLFGGHVVAAAEHQPAVGDALNFWEGLYTLRLRGVRGGRRTTMRTSHSSSVVRFVSLGGLLLAAALSAAEPVTIDIGTRRELLVDDFLLDRRQGVELRLHSPTPREVVFVCDAPWEGSGCGYETIFRDGNVIRMYYIAADLTSADGTQMAQRPIFACYAETVGEMRRAEKPPVGVPVLQQRVGPSRIRNSRLFP